MKRDERKQKLQSFGQAPAMLSAALCQFPKKMWIYKVSDDRWSIHEIILHLADSEAGSYSLLVMFTDIPVGGTLSVSVPGADKDSTFVDGAMSNREPTQGVGRGMRYPGHFQTSAVLAYTATRVAGGSIVATMKPYPTAPVEKES